MELLVEPKRYEPLKRFEKAAYHSPSFLWSFSMAVELKRTEIHRFVIFLFYSD